MSESSESTHTPLKLPATFMRGGTSKGVFFKLEDLPAYAQNPGPERDSLLLKVMGSPDPYGKQIDGMGGATSSTSKAIIVSKSKISGHDVEFVFGQVGIDNDLVDWSGNCGNLSAAVGPFAIFSGLIDSTVLPENGNATVRIWQAQTKQTIVAKVPMLQGEVDQTGDFQLDGVTFPSSEIALEFFAPKGQRESVFLTGNAREQLIVPELGAIDATLIDAGIPTVIINAEDLALNGTKTQSFINQKPEKLALLERIRVAGAIAMGLIVDADEALTRQHSPKIIFIAKPRNYVASDGTEIYQDQIDLLVRAVSMGKLHHAIMGTAAIALGTAAAIPNTLASELIVGPIKSSVTFGHPSGVQTIGAEVTCEEDLWLMKKALVSRSARVLMEGWVHLPVSGRSP